MREIIDHPQYDVAIGPLTANHTILVVEDDPARIGLLRHTMSAWKNAVQMFVAHDGAEALALLHHEGAFANTPRPHLILLDLHMPGMDGYAFLRLVKADQSLRRIPIVVLSGSDDEEEIAACLDLHANAYVIKAFTLEALMHNLRAIAEFWLQTACVPSF